MMLIKKFFKILLKKILKTKVVIACLSFVIYMYSKFVGATCKWQTIDFEKANDVVKDCNAIWVGWHSRATMMPYFWRRFFNRRMAALTSPHQDGQIIAKFLRWYGIDAVSGSTNEKARQTKTVLQNVQRANKARDSVANNPDVVQRLHKKYNRR
jgi:lysophospholipid acyltransferase (LPLAT)-like uncharacterized protein